MAILISPDSGYGKEMWKWNHFEDEVHDTDPKIRGMRKRAHQPYPVMLSKVQDRASERFHEVVAHDEQEQRNLESRGFVVGRDRAIAAYDQAQTNLAVEAAHRNYTDRNMGESARAEADAFEHTTTKHVAEIPEQPTKRRGRPRKDAVPA